MSVSTTSSFKDQGHETSTTRMDSHLEKMNEESTGFGAEDQFSFFLKVLADSTLINNLENNAGNGEVLPADNEEHMDAEDSQEEDASTLDSYSENSEEPETLDQSIAASKNLPPSMLCKRFPQKHFNRKSQQRKPSACKRAGPVLLSSSLKPRFVAYKW